MFLGVLLWGVYFMNFRDFFRILVSRRRSLSYQERVKNIMFRYYVFNSLSFIFLIVGACVLVFYYGFSKFMFLCALVIFGMVLEIFSGIYENCLRAEKDFRVHLGSWESTLIFAVESLYILFLLVLLWKMGLIGELFKY